MKKRDVVVSEDAGLDTHEVGQKNRVKILEDLRNGKNDT